MLISVIRKMNGSNHKFDADRNFKTNAFRGCQTSNQLKGVLCK